ncbi:MAG: DegT/DnrJ/EryC1/StrS family aminotransferase [Actinobacteria bacterium]|nr:DegT/DnrJ/EryC1/StrS family aminotransferase [Actinomycetota bacterium]
MTEMQAAIGRVQLQKLPDWTAARRRNAEILAERFSGCAPLRVTEVRFNRTAGLYSMYLQTGYWLSGGRTRQGSALLGQGPQDEDHSSLRRHVGLWWRA